ncbi:MAG: helix-turn-helix transcriptional regulator [Planctomycetota bacterium]
MAQAFINREILSWARQRAAIEPDALARSLQVDTSKYLAWEEGEKHPTFRQAQHLAKKLFIPFGYFFLPNVPEQVPQIPDLRTIRNEHWNQFSLEFQEVLQDVQRKQAWYKEMLIQDGAEPLPFIG